MGETHWSERNVLVTGASGLLGSWLTKTLVEKGANVVIIVRDVVPKSMLLNDSEIMKKITQVNGDVIDYFLIERTLNEYDIDTVFHLGAQTQVGTANRSPLGTFESNIKGTWTILEACRNSKFVKSIVVASSDKAYGSQKELPYQEDAPLQGEHPYDVSKSCTDLLAQSYFKTYGLPVAISRCGNLYGAGDLNFNRIMPGTIKSVHQNQEPIIRSDGTPIRDYLYVEDAVDAYLTLAEAIQTKNVAGEAFNFSTLNKLSVLDVANTILKVMNSQLKPKILNEAKGEIQDQYLSSEKASQVLGWKAKYDLEAGLRKAVPWYIDFFKNQ